MCLLSMVTSQGDFYAERSQPYARSIYDIECTAYDLMHSKVDDFAAINLCVYAIAPNLLCEIRI